MRFPAIAAGVALVASSTLVAQVTEAPARRVSGDRYDGVIMSIDGAGWSVTDKQIHEFESLLPNYLHYLEGHHSRLPSCPTDEYKRQYWVTRVGDEQLLWVHFYHRSTELVTSGRWLETPIHVSDGGDAFFTLRYTPKGQALNGFSINTGDQRTCRSAEPVR